MNTLVLVEFFVLGTVVGFLVLATPVFVIIGLREATKGAQQTSPYSKSGAAFVVITALLHPKMWLSLGLIAFGVYYLISHTLSASALSFTWGVAAGTPIFGAILLYGQRRRKRRALAKGNASSHVA
jgi:hypothetical protein